MSGQQWLWPHHVATKDGSRLQARRDAAGHVHFGRTRVSQCDHIATNGIVHTVTRVSLVRLYDLWYSEETGEEIL